MAEKPLVIVTEGSDAEPLNWLRERARVIETAQDSPEFAAQLKEADALVIRTYTPINEALLANAPQLKVIGRGGVGLEHIDLDACRRRGVRVVYTPNANTNAVGDYVFGVLLRLVRGWDFFPRERVYDPAEFKRARNRVRGRQLEELTLGIVGMGRVGRRVGQIASLGFGMRVIYNDLIDVSEHVNFPAQPLDKQMLFRQCDVLTIHVDMRPGNENLVGEQQLGMMKPAAILINASRGEILDARALADALRDGRLAAAAIDVYAPEPPPADFPLIGLDNVILTPHIASRTSSATQNMSWVVKDVMAVLDGEEPVYPAV